MSPAMNFIMSSPAPPATNSDDAAPFSDVETGSRSSKGIGIAIGVALLVTALVVFSTIAFFCIRRGRMSRSQPVPQYRTRRLSQAEFVAKQYPPPPPPPYEREGSTSPSPRDSRYSFDLSFGRESSWMTSKCSDSDSLREQGYGMIHVALPPSLADHPAYAYRPER